MASFTTEDVDALNTIARFLANEQISSLVQHEPIDVIVLVGSAILPTAEAVFSTLQDNPNLTKTLIICGGIGHSTELLYEALDSQPAYHSIADDARGLPEAQVFRKILDTFYPSLKNHSNLQILIEDKSTNCGANASETRKVLEQHNINSPSSIAIVQDPTMSLRTLAAFQKVYSDHVSPPKFSTCPTFIPYVELGPNSSLTMSVRDISPERLWTASRFLDLVMGEIPRLRDDEHGYGPKGKNFITHVDVPDEVEEAWSRLSKIITLKR